MGRVFEALQRQQKRSKGKKQSERDPLAAEIGTPEVAADQEPLTEFELPERIGAPTSPRSDEGMILPPLPDEKFTGAASEAVGADPHARVASAVNGVVPGELPMADFGLRDAELPLPAEIRNPQSAIRNPYAPPLTVEPQALLSAELDVTRLHPRLVMVTEPQSPGCEQYRTLRTQVFHAAERRLAQVIVITSAVAGEGKTSTALNLAWAIAQSREKRVLVIDSDLRRPNIAPYTGLKPESGFGEVLGGECEPLQAVRRIEGHGLYLLPVSCESTRPTELLSSERLGEALAELRRYFDFILIDSPPVVPFADARLLANHADAVMMVVRAGAAPYGAVERAIEALPSGRVLGVVLNGANNADESNYYDYYYNYHQRDKRQLFDWSKLSQRFGDWGWLGQRLGRSAREQARGPVKRKEPGKPAANGNG